MKVKPTFNRMLVEQIPDNDAVYGTGALKLVLPDGSLTKDELRTPLYKVLEVGSSLIEKYSVGDIIFKANFSSAAGIIFHGKKMLLLAESDIIGKLVLDPVEAN